MSKYYKTNLNNIDKFNFLDNKLNCEGSFKKDGKFIFAPFYLYLCYNQYLCMVNKIVYSQGFYFPYLYGKNEDEIVKNLLLFNYLKKFNLKYMIIDTEINKNSYQGTFDKYNYKNDYYIYIFNDDIKNAKNTSLNLLFLSEIIDEDKLMYDYYYKDLLSTLTTIFMISRNTIDKSISNRKILINMFYIYYINEEEFKKDLYDKYHKTRKDFPNYNELYIFLKKHGYVDKYYNVYASQIIKNYKIFYNKILNDPRLEKYKLKKEKKIKNFSDMNILKLIDNYVSDKFNKIYIKNKFIDLTKKYNV